MNSPKVRVMNRTVFDDWRSDSGLLGLTFPVESFEASLFRDGESKLTGNHHFIDMLMVLEASKPDN
jgi:hypothetical protein